MAKTAGRHLRREGPVSRSVTRHLPYLAVLAGVAGGLAWIGLHHFRRGSVLIAAAMLLAAGLRLLLPDDRIGLLRTRSRLVDVAVLATLGVALAAIALWVPPPS